MKKGILIFSLLIAAAATVLICYLLVQEVSHKKSRPDIPDLENNRIVRMFNVQIDRQIQNHTQSVMYPGYIPESRQNTILYLQAIQSIESYTRYGIGSTHPRNYLELRITFHDHTVADHVYTGHSCSGYMGGCLLMKAEMKNGQATRIFTNGQEKKGSPEWIIPSLDLMIEKAISYDIGRHPDRYFPPRKTQKDFDREWQGQK
ncbi:hypothetical protein [Chryseobacterium camelliae]|uniref:hypothetical protein n=1 Tax=Chryseobacterium camelliae TaxID=1265445 RepID=UPI000C1CACDC|nr:hypothetical protein [Chryseobacterium camelliae]